jgi:hypothetical protein
MAPYLAAVRNYWSLLPAIAVIVVLILLYAIPTLINPQWTSSILALFRQFPEDTTEQAPAGQAPDHAPTNQAQAQPVPAERAAGALGPKQIRSRRLLAGALVVTAIALIGFNITLNREANGCYQAARAWGAVDGDDAKDPCVHMIYGSFFGDGSGSSFEKTRQPVASYQLVRKKKPKYLKWIQNSPGYKDVDLLVGTSLDCNLDLRVEEGDDKITVLVDSDAPCPPSTNVSLTSVKLKKPLGDRKIVTVDDKPMQEINPDADSWPTVLKKLATGG